nr:hypothetical protein [Tanacetum cinerariifolium]
MASEQSSLGPALQEMTPTTISSGLVPKPSSSTSYVPPTRNDWDLLFQPLFDELLNPPPSVDSQNAEVIAPLDEVIPPVNDDSTGSPSSTEVDQDAPSLSHSPTTTDIQSPVISQDVGNENIDIEDLLFQPMFEKLLNPPPSVDHQAPEVIAPIVEVIPPVKAESTGSPSLTSIDQDAPLPSKSQTTPETQSAVIPQDVEEDNLDIEVSHIL